MFVDRVPADLVHALFVAQCRRNEARQSFSLRIVKSTFELYHYVDGSRLYDTWLIYLVGDLGGRQLTIGRSLPYVIEMSELLDLVQEFSDRADELAFLV